MTNIIGLGQDNAGKVINSRSVITEPLGIQRLTEITTATTYSAGISPQSGNGLNLPAIYSLHPEFSQMSVEAVSVSNKPGGLAEITTQYVGFINQTNFYWPPDQIPTTSSASPSSAPKIVPGIRLFPAGTKFNKFTNTGGDWLHFPIVVQISFIDSINNQELLYSDWVVGVTPIPGSFRGTILPQSPVAPYREGTPSPIPDGYVETIYQGVLLSSISVDQRGGLFNEVKLTFKDFVRTLGYSVQQA